MSKLSLEFMIDEYMVYCRSRQLREKTMASYEQSLRLFERWCREQMCINYVENISDGVIRRYINDLQERGKYTFYSNENAKATNNPDRRRDFRNPITTTTINNYIRNLRAFFNWMDADYLLHRNPMKKIRQLKSNRKAKEYLSDEDFKRLIGNLDKSYFSEHRDFAMIVLMMDTGMRLGECSSLLTDDIDLSRRQIFLRAETTKGRKDRRVFFSQKTEVIVRRWLQYKDRYITTDYLFPVKHNGFPIAVNNFEKNFKKYLQRAGLPSNVSPHCLRNNFAKRCLMSGMDIYTLSRILGHSSVMVTEQAYLDLTDNDLGKRYQHFSPLNNM